MNLEEKRFAIRQKSTGRFVKRVMKSRVYQRYGSSMGNIPPKHYINVHWASEFKHIKVWDKKRTAITNALKIIEKDPKLWNDIEIVEVEINTKEHLSVMEEATKGQLKKLLVTLDPADIVKLRQKGIIK